MAIMTLERLQWLRDCASDRLPKKILHGRGNFKVRRNWWQGLVGYLELGIKDGTISEELKPDVENFIEDYTSDKFHRQPLTTEGDIQRANDLLNRILGKNG